jgi:hypothetical protein
MVRIYHQPLVQATEVQDLHSLFKEFLDVP